MQKSSRDGAMEEPSGKAADEVYAAVVDWIVEGRLKPGDTLHEMALADSFGLSRTPVREALQRLTLEGLTERGARRAFHVRRLEPLELGDLFEAMGEIEALCARLSAQRMSPLERARLSALVDEGQAAAEADDTIAYTGINARFHLALFEGAHNASLREIALSLRMRTMPYRDAQFRQTERLSSSQTEHRRIVDAVMAEEPEAAFAAMRAHMTATSLNITRMLEAVGS
ncbi:MAG: GntR family transcriptional regulator [Shinella sp.]|nr:MAG: GntR family transcriptional regulator [Shinella sp.]